MSAKEANECISNEKMINPNNNNDSTSIEEQSSIDSSKTLFNNNKIENSSKNKFSNSNIKEVYEDNFLEEINKISILLEEDYTFIGMDTEFPGTVYNSKNYTKKNFYYETLKININSLKLIQLGITLRNKKGEFPTKYPYYTWQFNFKFDLEKDTFSPKSIKLLKNAGINFEKLKQNGIDYKIFAIYLITSGLVLNTDIHWICFQGSYDFGYLLQLLINKPLPETEDEFIELLNIYFPHYYDIRMLAKDKCCLQGSLNKLAKRLIIDRGAGDAHQAGSDSYITIRIFYKLIKCGIINKDLLKKNKNILYGIGLGEDNEMFIKYMKKQEKENLKKKNKDQSHTAAAENNNYNHNNIIMDSFNYENNNMTNNCLIYSNIKPQAFNYSLINMNCYAINYFNSNLFYNDNAKNVSNMIINRKLSIL